MRKINTFLIIPILLIFTSCVTINYERVKTFIDSNKKEGMLVGTISLENRKSIAGRHSFSFNKANLPNELNVVIHDSLKNKPNYSDYYDNVNLMNGEGDFEEDGKLIYLFNIVKPAGKYKFYQINIFLNSGNMQSSWTMPIEIPFQIEEGKTKYIGEINLKVKKGELQILNKIDRDRLKFKEKYPTINF
jgi:hypothetical protein